MTESDRLMYGTTNLYGIAIGILMVEGSVSEQIDLSRQRTLVASVCPSWSQLVKRQRESEDRSLKGDDNPDDSTGASTDQITD